MTTPFNRLTTVLPVGRSNSSTVYRASIDESWVLRPLPQGGVTAAIALSAMAAELDDPTQRLRTSHTLFAAQVPHGEVDVVVEVLRRGRTMSHLRAEVRTPGSTRGHLVTAAFGATRRGFDFIDVRPPPELPLPDDCPSFRDPPPPQEAQAFVPVPFWETRMEGRPALGNPPWDDYVPDRAERATWYRFDDPPMTAAGTLDPFSYPLLVDTMPSAVGQKLGPGQPSWFAPSVDLTLHVLDECRAPWVLGHNTARHSADGYASAEMTLWDYGPAFDDPRPIAYATQVFLYSLAD